MRLEFQKRKRVVIVDDSRTMQALVETAFAARNEFLVVGVASDAESGAAMIKKLAPDIATIDLCMPYLDGAGLLEIICDMRHVCKIIVSDYTARSVLMSAKLEALGASLCLGKRELVDNPAAFFTKISAACEHLEAGKTRHAPKAEHPAKTAAAEHNLSVAPASFPVPRDEQRRLEILYRKQLANAVRERQFDLITQHVVDITSFPVALLTFIDRDTQWIKSSYGYDRSHMPRTDAFCNYTICQDETFIVPNTATDPRFAQNALVTGEPHIRTYAGHPIVTRDGTRVGALCIVDTKVKAVSSAVIGHLVLMAKIIGEMIDVRPALAA